MIRTMFGRDAAIPDRKSTRLNSSHANISYAVFCLKKKKKSTINQQSAINNQQSTISRSQKRSLRLVPLRQLVLVAGPDEECLEARALSAWPRARSPEALFFCTLHPYLLPDAKTMRVVKLDELILHPARFPLCLFSPPAR